MVLAAVGDNLIQEAAAFTLQHRSWSETPGMLLTLTPSVAGARAIP